LLAQSTCPRQAAGRGGIDAGGPASAADDRRRGSGSTSSARAKIAVAMTPLVASFKKHTAPDEDCPYQSALRE
jgi:hypothetical protein